jgi:biotin transport system substrate-specific component
MHQGMKTSLTETIYMSLFTALMVVGTVVRIPPLGPIPIVLTNLFVLLSGLFLGPMKGLSSVAVYLFLGAVGLPVFTGGGGIALFAGPTGGFLVGYLFGAFVTGFVEESLPRGFISDFLALAAGAITIYIPGVFWLKSSLDIDFSAALTSGFLPFIIPDGIKIVAGCLIAAVLRKRFPELFPFLSGTQKKADADH